MGHALLQKPYSIEKWYVGLWRSDPTAAGSLAGEVEQADYDRKLVVWDSTFRNSNLISWAAAINNWGDITYVAVANSPSPKTGNVLAYTALAATFPMPIGQPAKINLGDLELVA